MDGRRVVVTGIGVISTLGVGLGPFREGLLGGRHGVAPISHFDATGLPVRVAAEARGYSDELLPSDPRHHRILSRPMRLGLVAAAEALASSGLDRDEAARAETAVLMTLNRQDIQLADFGESFARAMTAGGGEGDAYVFDRSRFFNRGVRALHPLWLLSFIPNLAVAHIARTFGLRGETNTYTAEAAAGLQVVGDAAQCIREGVYDVALCGGSDGRIDPVSFARYLALGVIAEAGPDEVDVSRPFDVRRRGYVLGEGAAFLVLEEASHAARRGARALAEVVGWGGGSDAYHPRSPHPTGRGVETAMRSALRSAQWGPDAIDLVVAAASSSVDYDASEAVALAAVFGDAEPAVTAPAGALGWTHSAAGSLAAVAAVIAVGEQKVPPTAGTTTPDAGAPRGLATVSRPCERRIRTALANASAIGGKSASAVFAEVER